MLEVVVGKHRIRVGERFSVSFQRTLRIPDDGRTYPLPPGLAPFPLVPLADLADVPAAWRDDGTALFPMYQREALWLAFQAASWKPNAVKVEIGGINAITGEVDVPGLRPDPQNYVVCPDQPWLDGIKTGRNTIRQFVAMPLGEGYTVEASVRGEETTGGIQVTVFEPKPGRFPDEEPPPSPMAAGVGPMRSMAPAQGMGLGAGGSMEQKIYPDPHGIDTWDPDVYGRARIYIVNSEDYERITQRPPPPSPIDAQTYTQHGFPWFTLYDEECGDVETDARLSGAKTVSARDTERGVVDAGDASVDVSEHQVRKLRTDRSTDRAADADSEGD